MFIPAIFLSSSYSYGQALIKYLLSSLQRKDVCMHPSCGAHSHCPGECDLGCIKPEDHFAGRFCGSSD